MPIVLRVRETITSPVPSCARRGATSTSHIRSSSGGGPGMATMMRPSFSTHQPGAVPRGLGMACAEGMSIACLTLRSGKVKPRAAKKERSRSSISLSTYISSSRLRAIASRVRSSSVGPRPPVMRTRSERLWARPTVSARRWRLSPAVET